MNVATIPEAATEPLPNDVAQCHAVIAQLVAIQNEMTATIRLQEREKAQLLYRVQQLVQQIYGRRSEKIDPAQLLLFAEAAMKDAAPEAALDAEAQPVEPKPKKKGHGRKKPPVELPRLPIEHPVAEADKICPHCGDARIRIGEEITEQSRVLPQSPIGKAVQYALNNWTALTRYCDDGDLAIDNNLAENALRGIAVGRKNWLFAGSDRGGRAAAVLYSLIGSAKRHDLDPFIYLRDLFLRIPTHPNKDLHQLLADSWKRDILPTLTTPPTL